MSRMQQVDIRLTSDVYNDTPLKYAMPGDAGIDLRSTESFVLQPGATQRVSAGFCMHIRATDIAAIIIPRSSSGSNGLVLANTAGLIDSGYQGDILVNLFNRSFVPITVTKGERICQMVFIPVAQAVLNFVESFEEATERGSGGYGSTGKR